jgi:hypothetical protein
MAIDVADMMVGPGRMRWAETGTDDALIVAGNVADWTGWNDVGPTDGGLSLAIAKDYANHEIDQTPDWVASTITSRRMTIQSSLVAAGNLTTLSLVNNGGVIASTNPSWTSYEPETDLISVQEKYIMVAVEGVTLEGKPVIDVVRRVLNVDSVAFEYKKDAKTMFGLSFAGHFVSDSVAPFIRYIHN